MGYFGVANRPTERGADAGAAVSHEQVKSGEQRYPVDRYLVESSNKMEMVNITEDEIWKAEPAFRPEDEVVLRKLHEMLQSTADDLKLISGELTKSREPRKQIKATPLDEEFNEKVHIEEIVNAKFHGYQIVRKPTQDIIKNNLIETSIRKPIIPKPKSINASVQVNQISNVKKATTTKNLTTSRTRLLQIDEQPQTASNNRAKTKKPLVTYNEYAYKYEEPKPIIRTNQAKPFDIQTMPSINIRGELKQQKVLQLDIIPEQKTDAENLQTLRNVAVIAMQHEPTPTVERSSKYPEVRYMSNATKPAVRKVSTMLTCDSSESSGNIPSQMYPKTRYSKPNERPSPKSSAPLKNKFTEVHNKAKLEKPFKSNIDEWRKKINTIYGPSTSKKPSRAKTTAKAPAKSDSIPTQSYSKPKSLLNNAEYIPYSKLTLGGVNVSDIEREISDLTDKNVPLSPILDKILISRENSFHEGTSKKDNANKNILTTSDENLLEEVLDIERDITSTLNKNLKGKDNTISDVSSKSNHSSNGKSYVDDFEEERSDIEKSSEEFKSKHSNIPKDDNIDEDIQTGIKDTTYTKSPKLSFKNTVDVYEFIHSIDRQDNATQSNGGRKMSLKSTQTSPRNVQPIRNDLWPEPSQTPIMKSSRDVEKILNEDFIKKLIVDECTDILQKNLSKPSTSKETKKNFVASQKNTQTSPAHMKSVMTSPTRTKSRMTSPLALSLTVDHQTSPIEFPTNEDNLHIELDKIEDLAISINLSSPRFSLRLPKDSREVLSNLDGTLRNGSKVYKPVLIKKISSSSSADADYSSDMSSLGEINDKLRRRQRRTKYPSISESTTSNSKYSSDISSVVLPLKSEGEISLGQVERRHKLSRSDGEMSLGKL